MKPKKYEISKYKLKGGPVFTFSLPGGRLMPLLTYPITPLVIYVACIILFVLQLCRESHKIVCSTADVCNKLHGKMYSSKHCSN